MADREKVIKWFEYDYLPRVGAYRKDCKQGCDACAPMHDGDDYCDIDMLCKILDLLKEQEAVVRCKDCKHGVKSPTFRYYPNTTWCHKHSKLHNDDWFCADGESKEIK